MTLMDRINLKDFLSMDHHEQLVLVMNVREKRVQSLRDSRDNKVKVTKSAAKNNPKKRMEANTAVNKLAKLLESMPQKQMAKLLGGLIDV